MYRDIIFNNEIDQNIWFSKNKITEKVSNGEYNIYSCTIFKIFRHMQL